MVIRKLISEDRMELEKLWSICFNSQLDLHALEERCRAGKDTGLGFGSFTEDGKMTAAMLGNELFMNFDGEPAMLLGVGGVCSDPCYRRDGAVRRILKTLLSCARESGHVFSGLYPFSHQFYRKYGYELAHTLVRCSFPIDALKPYLGPVEARMLLPEDDRSMLSDVYKAFALRYQLSVSRSVNAMNAQTRSNPYAANEYAYALFDEGQCTAYVVFRKENTVLCVTDYAFSTGKGFRMILSFLARFSAEYETVKMLLTDDIPLASMLPCPYDFTQTAENCYMLRVLNCEKALSLLKRDFPFRFVLEVHDDFLSENSGRWLIANGQCQFTDAPADCTLSIQAFSELMSGYTSFSGIAFRDDVTVASNRDMLDRVFVKKPSFIGIHY